MEFGGSGRINQWHASISDCKCGRVVADVAHLFDHNKYVSKFRTTVGSKFMATEQIYLYFQVYVAKQIGRAADW
jgi:hypothetical protein